MASQAVTVDETNCQTTLKRRNSSPLCVSDALYSQRLITPEPDSHQPGLEGIRSINTETSVSRPEAEDFSNTQACVAPEPPGQTITIEKKSDLSIQLSQSEQKMFSQQETKPLFDYKDGDLQTQQAVNKTEFRGRAETSSGEMQRPRKLIQSIESPTAKRMAIRSFSVDLEGTKRPEHLPLLTSHSQDIQNFAKECKY